MRNKKKWLLIGTALLVVVVFVSTGLVIAKPSGPFAYPGPFGPYEDDTVTVACVQIFRGVDSSATLNKMLVKAKEAIEAGADIVLFAEYILKTVEPIPGPSSLAMAEITESVKKDSGRDVYIVYGCGELDGTDRYNAAAIIGPKGVIGSYRKISPGPNSTESRGRKPVAFQTPWGPVGVSICYDTYAWPEIARTYSLMGSRLILNPTGVFHIGGVTNFPGLIEQMHEGTSARVRENFVFVATCNKIDPHPAFGPTAKFSGQSTIKGPTNFYGRYPSWVIPNLAGPAGEGEETIMATLDLSKSDQARRAAYTFEPNPQPGYKGEPEFVPQWWADLWGRGWRGKSEGVLLN